MKDIYEGYINPQPLIKQQQTENVLKKKRKISNVKTLKMKFNCDILEEKTLFEELEKLDEIRRTIKITQYKQCYDKINIDKKDLTSFELNLINLLEKAITKENIIIPNFLEKNVIKENSSVSYSNKTIPQKTKKGGIKTNEIVLEDIEIETSSAEKINYNELLDSITEGGFF